MKKERDCITAIERRLSFIQLINDWGKNRIHLELAAGKGTQKIRGVNELKELNTTKNRIEPGIDGIGYAVRGTDLKTGKEKIFEIRPHFKGAATFFKADRNHKESIPAIRALLRERPFIFIDENESKYKIIDISKYPLQRSPNKHNRNRINIFPPTGAPKTFTPNIPFEGEERFFNEEPDIINALLEWINK